jgi:hypothetical protein
MIGMGRLAPRAGCGCGEAATAFLAIEYPALDGTIHSEGGRFCAVHGAEFAAEIPRDVGPITVRIFDWQGLRVTIGVHSRGSEGMNAA